MGEETTTPTPRRAEPAPESMSDEEATDLVQRYENLVYKVAHRLHRDLPEQIDIQDLIGWGYAGLLEAHQRYDEEKSTQFASFAYYRIRGAMLDACPEPVMDPKRRLADVSCNEVLNTYAHVVQSHKSQASLESRLSAMSDVTGSMAMVFVLRDCPSKALRSGGAPHNRMLTRRQTAEKVRRILKDLPELEQSVLIGVYFEGRSLTDIGEKMGYSPSWVSRMHSRALNRLRKRIRCDDDLDDLRQPIPV